jgi:hypothetical protein
VLIETELGVGVVHDLDLPELVGCLCGSSGGPLEDRALDQLLTGPLALGADLRAIRLKLAGLALRVSPIRSIEVPTRFGFDPNPRPAPGEPEC